MKKLRLERQGQTFSTLSQKRGSLNQEQLFVPYKVDWRAASPINVENNHTNKAFFQNMKAELSTIKNDFEKLIRKEINLKVEEDEPLKSVNTNKPKHYSTSKKETRSISENEKLHVVMGSKKNQEDHFNRILNLQKNLPCSSGNQMKQSLVKTLKVKEQIPVTTQFNTVQIESPVVTQNYFQKENQIFGLKDKINYLQVQLQNGKLAIQSLQSEARVVREQNQLISSKASQLSSMLSLRDNQLKEKEGEIQLLKEQIGFISEQSNQFKVMEHNWINERNYLNQQLHQLSYHHQQLSMANQQFSIQNNQLRVTIDGLQRFCQDLQNRCSDIENDWKRKLQYLQKDISSYQKRQDMFAAQIQKLNLQLTESLSEKQRQITSVTDSEMRNEILQLKDEIFHLKRQVAIEKDLHQNLAKKCEEKAESTAQIQELSRTFEFKINELIDQNVRLKTKLNHADSKVQSFSEQNKSYLQQIRLYQQREGKMKARRQLQADEWQLMTQEIENLKEINQRLTDQLQFKQFTKETEQHSQNNVCNQELIALSHQQREQIELLKQNIKQLITNNRQLEQNMLIQMNLSKGVTKGALQMQLQQRVNQIKLLKQMIFSIIVQKLGKRQDEEEIQYYLRSFDQIRSKMTV